MEFYSLCVGDCSGVPAAPWERLVMSSWSSMMEGEGHASTGVNGAGHAGGQLPPPGPPAAPMPPPVWVHLPVLPVAGTARSVLVTARSPHPAPSSLTLKGLPAPGQTGSSGFRGPLPPTSRPGLLRSPGVPANVPPAATLLLAS